MLIVQNRFGRLLRTRIRGRHLLALLLLLAFAGGAIAWWFRPIHPPDPYVALAVRDINVAENGLARIRADGWKTDSLAKCLETLP